MTLTTETNSKEYTANGSTPAFAYDFLILDEDHMKVYLDGVLQTTGYTVSGVGVASGGEVTFSVNPASGVRVSLYRVVPMTQQTDYLPYDPFPADTHETGLDKLTMLVQQTYEITQRAITAPIGGDPDVDYTLPQYAAGKGIMWNEVTKELTVTDDDLNDIVSDATAQAAAAASSASTASTQAGLATAAKTDAETAQAAAELAETGAEAQVVLCQDEVVNAAAQVTLAEAEVALAEAARDKAEDWAEEVEDTEVETGKYSALHWAAKAEEHVTDVYITNNQWTAGQRYVKDTASIASGTRNIDLLAEPFIELTVTGDFTLGVTNFANAGLGCELHIIMDGTGGHTIGLSGDLDPAGYDVGHNDTASARTVYWLTSIGSKVLIRKMWEDD